MDSDGLAGIEGEAERAHREAGSDPDDPVSMAELCERLTDHAPLVVRQPQAGRLLGERVLISSRLADRHVPHVIGHELAHLLLVNYCGADLEAACDALGAALVAPRRAFLSATRQLGHSVTQLAEVFSTSQSLVLLRIGETSGRPVALLSRPTPFARGEWHQWPAPREAVHPIRLSDDGRWGLMWR